MEVLRYIGLISYPYVIIIYYFCLIFGISNI